MGPSARKYALKDMTFAEFRERMNDRPLILLPFASQEEQGPQAPMGDFMLTERLSIMTAERADAIAARLARARDTWMGTKRPQSENSAKRAKIEALSFLPLRPKHSTV